MNLCISSMKKGAFLVNIAREGLLEYSAVLSNLKSGHLGGLGIDVAWTEPFNPDDPVLELPNVLITPFCAGWTRLTHLDLFGTRISDSGTECMCYFKNLQSLEICGGGIIDAGVKNIKHLGSLTRLNLSQNCNLTDKSLGSISGLTTLVSLNVANSRITNNGLRHLEPLKNL